MTPGKDSMDARGIKDALIRRHSARSGEWVCIEEAFSGWTSMSGGIDLFAIGAWQTAKAKGLPGSGYKDACYPMVAYEVKVSRSDFRRDIYGPGTKEKPRPILAWPAKQRDALAQSHYFMFATPAGLLTDEEIERREPWEEGRKGRPLWLPPETGLIEVGEDGRCRVRVDAPKRECPPPLPRAQIAELIRHAVDPAKARDLRDQNKRLLAEVSSLREQRDRRFGYGKKAA